MSQLVGNLFLETRGLKSGAWGRLVSFKSVELALLEVEILWGGGGGVGVLLVMKDLPLGTYVSLFSVHPCHHPQIQA